MCAHCFLRKRLRATFGSMQAVFGRRFSKGSKTFVNIDFFAHSAFQKPNKKAV